ncbi:MAG: M28 family peptidase [Cyclobacteriaceae bacterium]
MKKSNVEAPRTLVEITVNESMKKFFTLILLVAVALGGYAQKKSDPPFEQHFINLRNTFRANDAFETVKFVEPRWRLAGNTGFNESIEYVEKILQQAGFKKEVTGEADGPLTYRIETRKMRRPTWEPVSASLTIAGEATPILMYATNHNMMAVNSASTPEEGVTAEVIDVGQGTKQDFEGKEVAGKIVLGEAGARSLYSIAMEKGAVGVLAYSMPAYNQPEKHVNSIQFQNIPLKDIEQQKWAILLSYQAKEKLKAALAKGTLRVTVKTITKIYTADEFTLVANARGTTHPDERFVFSAHVQEPGANDNATGVGTLAEMARTTAELIQQKKFIPQRTITFLWGDEIISTDRYIKDDAVRARGIKWGLSLDMVGEDVSKTGGTFLIEKMPDPSAIWTRGKEKHTEWGGNVLTESQMFPHYFNDLLLNRCYQQARTNGWNVQSNPFEGGSDHTPFLQAKIPGLLMWHFTDVFYHTDRDRIDMVSAEEMKNVGVSALATAYLLCSANENETLLLVDEVSASAHKRLAVEFELSKEAIKAGSKKADEQRILEVWTDWYVKAIGTMTDIQVSGSTEGVTLKINHAQGKLQQKRDELINALNSGK